MTKPLITCKSNNHISNLQLFASSGEHIKFESVLGSFAKQLMFTKKCPKEIREAVIKEFNTFLNKK